MLCESSLRKWKKFAEDEKKNRIKGEKDITIKKQTTPVNSTKSTKLTKPTKS